MRCKLARLCTADTTGCLLGTGRLAVIVRCKLTRLCAADATGCLLGTGGFAVIVRCKLAVFLAASRARRLGRTGCRAARMRICALGSHRSACRAGHVGRAVPVVRVGRMCRKLTRLCAADTTGCLLGTSRLAVIVCRKLARLCAADTTGCLLGTGRLAIIVRCKLARLCAADTTGCLLGTGGFAVIVRRKLTVFLAASRARCLGRTGCRAARMRDRLGLATAFALGPVSLCITLLRVVCMSRHLSRQRLQRTLLLILGEIALARGTSEMGRYARCKLILSMHRCDRCN